MTNGVKPLQSSPGRLASHLHAERQAQPQAAGLLPWPRFPAVLCVRLRRTSPESVSRICTILKHQKYTLKNRPFSVACLGASINGQWEYRNFVQHLGWSLFRSHQYPSQGERLPRLRPHPSHPKETQCSSSCRSTSYQSPVSTSHTRAPPPPPGHRRRRRSPPRTSPSATPKTGTGVHIYLIM